MHIFRAQGRENLQRVQFRDSLACAWCASSYISAEGGDGGVKCMAGTLEA
ncbi:hypothetical protein [Segatella baroniae]|nr:hypothetical protein [Segatella baroniae]